MRKQALRCGKNLAISEDTMLRKGKSAVEGDPKKGWSGIEAEAGTE